MFFCTFQLVHNFMYASVYGLLHVSARDLLHALVRIIECNYWESKMIQGITEWDVITWKRGAPPRPLDNPSDKHLLSSTFRASQVSHVKLHTRQILDRHLVGSTSLFEQHLDPDAVLRDAIVLYCVPNVNWRPLGDHSAHTPPAYTPRIRTHAHHGTLRVNTDSGQLARRSP